MKKLCRFTFMLMFVSILFCGCFCLSASAETLTGDLGDGFTWELDTETRTVTFRGNGELPAWERTEVGFPLSSSFDRVVLDIGITGVSKEFRVDVFFPKTIVLGKDIHDSENLIAAASESYEVDPENPYFASYKGGLYTKDYTKLIAYPTDRAPVEICPKTNILGEQAFLYYGHLVRDKKIERGYIVVPWGVTTIEGACFEPYTPITVVLPDTAIRFPNDRIYVPSDRAYDAGSEFIFSKYNSQASKNLYYSGNSQESGRDISQYYGLTPNSLKTFQNGKTYYFDQNSQMVKGWKQVNGTWYYFNDYGAAVVKIWLKSGNKWYFMQADGTMAKSRWIKWYNKWYYVDASGAMYANRWIKSSGKWYYLGSDGAMYTNRYTPDGYWVNADGVWV